MLCVFPYEVENKDSFMVHGSNNFDCKEMSGLPNKCNWFMFRCVFLIKMLNIIDRFIML